MIPISTTISGIGPYREPVTIDWAGLASPTALVGPRGNGKTHAAEAIPGALFGAFPWYGDFSLYNRVSKGMDRGEIRLVFEAGGARYEAVRTIRVSGAQPSQKVMLYDAAGVAVAGPNQKDFDRAIVNLIGDYETFIATSFMAQNRAGDICGTPGQPGLAAFRRQIIAEQLGLNGLDAMAERVADEARGEEAEAKVLEAQLLGAGDPAAEREVVEGLLSQEQGRLNAARTALQTAEADLEAARAALRDSEGGDDVLKAQIAEHVRAERAVADCQARLDRLEVGIKALEVRASGLDAARNDLARLNESHVRRVELRGAMERYQAWAAWDARRAELARAVEHAGQMVATLEATPGVDAKTRVLAGRVEELMEAGLAAKGENEARAERNAALGLSQVGLKVKIHGAKERTRDLMARRDSKPVTPFGEKCAPCPLMREYAGLEDQILAIGVEAEGWRKELIAIPADEPLTDLSELRAQYEQARAAAEAVKAAASAADRLDVAREVLESARDAERDHAGAHAAPAPDPSADLHAIQANIDRLAGAAERVEACETAEMDMEAKRAEFEDADGSRMGAESDASHYKPIAASARAALADREAGRKTIRDRVQALASGVADARAGIEALGQEIARHEARIAELGRRESELDAKREQAGALRADIEVLADLRRCFGPRGIRQTLIDAAAPELESIADDLFERATGGQRRLRIQTQRADRAGILQEDFSIMVKDAVGERDALEFSGGELVLNQIVMRLAMALWSARIRGITAECIVLDEPFGAAGEEGTEEIFALLEYIATFVGKIIVITHSPEAAARMRSELRFHKTFSGVQIVTRPAASAF